MTRVRLTPDQAAVAETLEGGMLVAAGAGSGKTRTITERAANAVIGLPGWEPVDITEVLAITFTEKAAGELAERVRAALRAAGRGDQASRVDGASISTIHALCSRIVRAESLGAGVDPSFSVLNSVESGQLRELAFEKVVKGFDPGDPVVSLLSAYGVGQIAECVFALGSAVSRGVALVPERAENPARLVAEAADDLETLSGRIRACGVEGEAAGQHVEACDSTCMLLRELGASGAEPAVLAEQLWRILTSHRVPTKYAGIKEYSDEHKAIVRDVALRAVAVITREWADALLRLTHEWVSCFNAMKQERGALDFDDLQTEALRILRDPRVAEKWRARYRLTMVDEFQDTDGVQLELVNILSGSRNLCTVGDERQSIYRFRGADIKVFRDHEAAMRASGAAPQMLRENFRSHPTVLAFANRLFGDSALFGPGLIKLVAKRAEPDPPRVSEDTPRVHAMLALQKGAASVRPRRALAAAVARELSRILRAAENGRGDIAAGDVVVLVRSYSHATEYAEALRREGVPALVVGGGRFLLLSEVCALRSLCRVITNRRDESALVALLASDIGALSDDDLFALRSLVRRRQADGLWQALRVAAKADSSSRTATAFGAIQAAVERSGRMPLAELLLRAVEDFGYDLRLLSDGIDGGEAYANVLKFARLADSFEASGGAGVSAFSAYLDMKEKYRDHEPPATLAGGGSDVVRIMSIHASKGLEFPVVVVPELGAGDNGNKLPARWRGGDDPVLALKLPSSWTEKPNKSVEFERIAEEESIEEIEELKRLFYVACTRAKEVLILAGSASATSRANSMMNWLTGVFGLTPGASAEVDLGDGHRMVVTGVDVPEEDEGCGEGASEGPTAPTVAAPVAAAGQTSGSTEVVPGGPLAVPTLDELGLDAPRRLSYSAVAAFERCGLRFKAERHLRLRKVGFASGSEATRVGSAVHAVLELAGERGEIDELRVRAISAFHGLDDVGVERVARAVDAYRASHIAEKVASQSDVRREAPFALALSQDGEQVILAGNIDVLATESDRALIVDYKTGLADTDDDRLRESYEFQAGCYALAAQRAGHDDIEVVFVRPEAPRRGDEIRHVSFRFTPEELKAVEARVLEAFRKMVAGEYESRLEWDSGVCGDCPLPSALCEIRSAHDHAAGHLAEKA